MTSLIHVGCSGMLFLDIDDTLIDHSGAQRDGARIFGAHCCDAIPDYDYLDFPSRWHDVAERYMADFLSGKISFQEQRRRRLKEIFKDAAMSDTRADELFRVYLRCYEKSWKLFPDVIPFLEANAGSGVGIISDGSHEQQTRKLRQLGIHEYFLFIISAESTGFCKPDPRIFHRACEVAGVTPDSACYIGDNLNKDAIGASEAGLRGIWINRSGAAVPDGVESIESLLEYMPDTVL